MPNQKESSVGNKSSIWIWIAILAIAAIVATVIAGCFFYKIGTSEESQTPVVIQTEMSPANTQTTTNQANSSTKTTAEVDSGQIYYNSRFGYSVQEPTGFSRFESQNGDGASFSKDSPAVAIGVYGANNIENLTATQYLDKEYSTLQMGTPDLKELSWSTVNIDGCTGEKRAWQYTPATGGGQDIEVSAVCMKGSTVYGMYMTLSANDYSNYSSVFDNVLTSFKFAGEFK